MSPPRAPAALASPGGGVLPAAAAQGAGGHAAPLPSRAGGWAGRAGLLQPGQPPGRAGGDEEMAGLERASGFKNNPQGGCAASWASWGCADVLSLPRATPSCVGAELGPVLPSSLADAASSRGGGGGQKSRCDPGLTHRSETSALPTRAAALLDRVGLTATAGRGSTGSPGVQVAGEGQGTGEAVLLHPSCSSLLQIFGDYYHFRHSGVVKRSLSPHQPWHSRLAREPQVGAAWRAAGCARGALTASGVAGWQRSPCPGCGPGAGRARQAS